MATELVRKMDNGHSSEKDTLVLMGGVAMVVVGAGLILSSPAVRRYMGQMGIGNVLGNIIPDVERYFKLRSM